MRNSATIKAAREAAGLSARAAASPSGAAQRMRSTHAHHRTRRGNQATGRVVGLPEGITSALCAESNVLRPTSRSTSGTRSGGSTCVHSSRPTTSASFCLGPSLQATTNQVTTQTPLSTQQGRRHENQNARPNRGGAGLGSGEV